MGARPDRDEDDLRRWQRRVNLPFEGREVTRDLFGRVMVLPDERVRAFDLLNPRPPCATHSHLTFVDIVPQMIDADGKPRKELLVQDGLHMTPAGYKIWNDALRPLLQLSQSNR